MIYQLNIKISHQIEDDDELSFDSYKLINELKGVIGLVFG